MSRAMIQLQCSMLHEVLPHLFLGGVNHTDPETLKEYQIKTVLTVMDCDLPETYKAKAVKFHWIKKFDMPTENLLVSFPEIVTLISESLGQGNVLVHCQGGISRSVSAIISYMIAVLNFTRDESLKIIQEQSRWAHPNSGFMEQLATFESEVRPHWTEEGAGEPYRRHIAQIMERQKAEVQGYFFVAEEIIQKRSEDKTE